MSAAHRRRDASQQGDDTRHPSDGHGQALRTAAALSSAQYHKKQARVCARNLEEGECALLAKFRRLDFQFFEEFAADDDGKFVFSHSGLDLLLLLWTKLAGAYYHQMVFISLKHSRAAPQGAPQIFGCNFLHRHLYLI
jgi:hypothetical protein